MFLVLLCLLVYIVVVFFFFQAEDGIRDLVRSRGLGDVYKRQESARGGRRQVGARFVHAVDLLLEPGDVACRRVVQIQIVDCLLYTSDAADERSSVDLGGRRIIKKKNNKHITVARLS